MRSCGSERSNACRKHWEALELYAGSTFARKLLGDHIFTKYLEAKDAEWKKYRAEVTDWEVAEYLYKF